MDWATRICAPFFGIINKAKPKTKKKVAAAAAATALSPRYTLINFISVKLYNIDIKEVRTIGKPNLNKFVAILPDNISTFLRNNFSPFNEKRTTLSVALFYYFLNPNFSIRTL